jgi:hypothetical protein
MKRSAFSRMWREQSWPVEVSLNTVDGRESVNTGEVRSSQVQNKSALPVVYVPARLHLVVDRSR